MTKITNKIYFAIAISVAIFASNSSIYAGDISAGHHAGARWGEDPNSIFSNFVKDRQEAASDFVFRNDIEMEGQDSSDVFEQLRKDEEIERAIMQLVAALIIKEKLKLKEEPYKIIEEMLKRLGLKIKERKAGGEDGINGDRSLGHDQKNEIDKRYGFGKQEMSSSGIDVDKWIEMLGKTKSKKTKKRIDKKHKKNTRSHKRDKKKKLDKDKDKEEVGEIEDLFSKLKQKMLDTYKNINPKTKYNKNKLKIKTLFSFRKNTGMEKITAKAHADIFKSCSSNTINTKIITRSIKHTGKEMALLYIDLKRILDMLKKHDDSTTRSAIRRINRCCKMVMDFEKRKPDYIAKKRKGFNKATFFNDLLDELFAEEQEKSKKKKKKKRNDRKKHKKESKRKIFGNHDEDDKTLEFTSKKKNTNPPAEDSDFADWSDDDETNPSPAKDPDFDGFTTSEDSFPEEDTDEEKTAPVVVSGHNDGQQFSFASDDEEFPSNEEDIEDPAFVQDTNDDSLPPALEPAAHQNGAEEESPEEEDASYLETITNVASSLANSIWQLFPGKDDNNKDEGK